MGPAHPAELRVTFPLASSSPAPCIPLQRVLLKGLGASRLPLPSVHSKACTLCSPLDPGTKRQTVPVLAGCFSVPSSAEGF